MSRPSLIRAAALALALALPASRSAAQSTTAADSTPPVHMLAPVTVEASRGRSLSSLLDAMRDIRAAEFENRRLAHQLKQYDRQVAQLESRLTYLKTVVTDSLRRSIAATDSATAATRAERMRLEQLVRVSDVTRASSDSVGGR